MSARGASGPLVDALGSVDIVAGTLVYCLWALVYCLELTRTTSHAEQVQSLVNFCLLTLLLLFPHESRPALLHYPRTASFSRHADVAVYAHNQLLNYLNLHVQHACPQIGNSRLFRPTNLTILNLPCIGYASCYSLKVTRMDTWRAATAIIGNAPDAL